MLAVRTAVLSLRAPMSKLTWRSVEHKNRTCGFYRWVEITFRLSCLARVSHKHVDVEYTPHRVQDSVEFHFCTTNSWRQELTERVMGRSELAPGQQSRSPTPSLFARRTAFLLGRLSVTGRKRYGRPKLVATFMPLNSTRQVRLTRCLCSLFSS